MEIVEKEIVQKVKYVKLGNVERPLAQIKDIAMDLDVGSTRIDDIPLRDVLEKNLFIDVNNPIHNICSKGEKFEDFFYELEMLELV